jgi:hypothetical protein
MPLERKVSRFASQISCGRTCCLCTIVIALAFTLAGCGNKYRVPMPSSSIGTGLLGGEGRHVSLNRPFHDERPQYDYCEKEIRKKTRPRLECSPEAPVWIADAFANALEAAGLQIDTEPDAAPADAVHIEGTLAHFAIEDRPGFSEVTSESDAHVRLVLSTDSGLRAERSFFAKSARASSMATNKTMGRTAMREVSERIIHEMVAAVLSLLNRYPELGRPQPVAEAAPPEAVVP